MRVEKTKENLVIAALIGIKETTSQYSTVKDRTLKDKRFN